MVDNFTSPADRQRLMQRFFEAQMPVGGDPREYGNTFTDIVRHLVMLASPIKITDEQILQRYIAGLTPEQLRYAVGVSQPKDLDQLQKPTVNTQAPIKTTTLAIQVKDNDTQPWTRITWRLS